jgi:hypothetical protein
VGALVTYLPTGAKKTKQALVALNGLRVLVQSGDVASGVQGATFSTLQHPIFNAQQYGFAATLAPLAGKSLPSAARTGLWISDFSQTVCVLQTGNSAFAPPQNAASQYVSILGYGQAPYAVSATRGTMPECWRSMASPQMVLYSKRRPLSPLKQG